MTPTPPYIPENEQVVSPFAWGNDVPIGIDLLLPLSMKYHHFSNDEIVARRSDMILDALKSSKRLKNCIWTIPSFARIFITGIASLFLNRIHGDKTLSTKRRFVLLYRRIYLGIFYYKFER